MIVSLEPEIEKIEPNEVFAQETERMEKIVKSTKLLKSKSNLEKKEKDKNAFLTDLIMATDNFIVDRPEFGLHSILAGFPWFLDWGRDTCIAFEGLLLITKRYDLAREVLLTLTRDIQAGLVPNGYSELDNTPLYKIGRAHV